MSKPLANQVIFISGASRGIGAELAKACGQQGALCLLLARDIPKLEAVYDEIVAHGGPEPIILKLDLLSADPAAYQALAERVSNSVEKIDALYHLATHQPKLTPIEHYDIRHWFEVMQVNCHAPFLLTQALMPLLKNAPTAKIIFPSTDFSENVKAFWGAHSCAAAAMKNFRELLTTELENTAITTHTLNPGPTNTMFRRRAYPAEDLQILKAPEVAAKEFLNLL